jgi:hypothetical protein
MGARRGYQLYSAGAITDPLKVLTVAIGLQRSVTKTARSTVTPRHVVSYTVTVSNAGALETSGPIVDEFGWGARPGEDGHESLGASPRALPRLSLVRFALVISPGQAIGLASRTLA